MAKAIEKHVGRGVKRVEDPRYLTGQGQYLDDLRFLDLLHARFLRSPHAHARIRGIETSHAREAPGVVGVWTGGDLAGAIKPIGVDDALLPGFKRTPWPALATHTVRFVGEPVAVVVATDRYAAEDATELIEVDYEPLPVVVDVEQALELQAPRVHGEWPDNILMRAAFQAGDVEQALAEADLVIRESFSTAPVTGIPIEPRGCLAALDRGRGVLTLWTSHQSPHILRTILADLLNLPEHQLHVIVPDIGGEFGIKLHVYPEEPIVCALALQLQRPVKWVQDRREDLLCNVHCREHRYQIEAAVRRDGRVTGLRARIIADAGAYSILPFGSTLEATGAARQLLGPYKIERYQHEALAMATNKPPRGAYRGVAQPTPREAPG